MPHQMLYNTVSEGEMIRRNGAGGPEIISSGVSAHPMEFTVIIELVPLNGGWTEPKETVSVEHTTAELSKAIGLVYRFRKAITPRLHCKNKTLLEKEDDFYLGFDLV